MGEHRRLLPTAKEILKQSALKEAEKAEEYTRIVAAAEAEKRALVDELAKPSGLKRRRKNKTRFDRHPARRTKWTPPGPGHPFPNILCTDRVRAYEMEPGWEKTLPEYPTRFFNFGMITCSRAATRLPIKSLTSPAWRARRSTV